MEVNRTYHRGPSHVPVDAPEPTDTVRDSGPLSLWTFGPLHLWTSGPLAPAVTINTATTLRRNARVQAHRYDRTLGLEGMR